MRVIPSSGNSRGEPFVRHKRSMTFFRINVRFFIIIIKDLKREMLLHNRIREILPMNPFCCKVMNTLHMFKES